MTDPTAMQLLESASTASDQAYCPFSKFSVGAALQAPGGNIFCGCNVENASFGLTNCAERTAVFLAVSAGERKFSAIAIVADGEQIPYPCGACRQVLSEFCDPGLKIYVAAKNDLEGYESYTLGDLLPKSFNL